MPRAPRRLPAAFLLVLFLGVLVAPAGAAFAEDEAPAKPAAEADATPAEVLTEADLVKLFLDKPKALWALGLLKIVPIFVGVGLLIAALVRHLERKREGLARVRTPVVLTQPFDLMGAVGMFFVGFLVVPSLFVGVYATSVEGAVPLWMKILAMGVGTVSAALLVALRRQRLALQRADGGEAATALTQPPGAWEALKGGLGAVCIAFVLMTPLAMVWSLLVEAVAGAKPPLQELVIMAIDPATTYEPWLIAAFGVLVAPFAEEAIFRGMLYPALRRVLVGRLGGERRAAWLAAVSVSLLFAAVHGSWLAAAPLFVLAMVLTWLFERTNSLAACVVAHAAHNAFTLIPVLLLRLP